MIANCPPGDKILDIDIHIPYMPVRKSTTDYKKNPEMINIVEISNLTTP